jgi:hypothetical protein
LRLSYIESYIGLSIHEFLLIFGSFIKDVHSPSKMFRIMPQTARFQLAASSTTALSMPVKKPILQIITQQARRM